MHVRGPLRAARRDLDLALAVSPSCPGCGASEPAPAFAPLAGSCRCGQRVELALPLAAELRTPTAGAGLVSKRRWLNAIQQRAQGGPFVLEVCPSCSGPVTVPAETTLELACSYCDETHELPLLEHAVDVLPVLELSARTWGGGMDLRWVPEVRHGAVDEPTACPHCGAEVAGFSGSSSCPHCDGALFAFTACGRRFLPRVRVEGDDEGRKLGDWLPLPVALEHYAQRRHLARASGRSTCALIAALFALFPAGCVLALSFPLVGGLATERFGPAGAVAALAGYAVLMALPFVLGVAIAISLHRRRRARPTG